MANVILKMSEIRKQRQIGQQELAEVLGITYQTVSKWETGITMPDIMLLPDIAEFFNVSVDELLGLKPLRKQQYIQRGTDDRAKIAHHFSQTDIEKSFLKVQGLMITYGTK